MLLGIGIDIVEIERIADLLQRQPAFINRILTPMENVFLSQIVGQRAVEYVAGRFAAKEAASKALGTGIGAKLSFTDIEIVATENGKPVIHIALEVLTNIFPTHSNLFIHVSISHSRAYAVAQVMIEQV